MGTATDWTCPCRAVNSHASVWCEACGDERPGRAARGLAAVPKVPEMHQSWTPPDRREPTPDEDREIRATLAALKNASWWRTTQGTAALPTVDPAIRAEVERRSDGPQRLADLLAAELKGAPR